MDNQSGTAIEVRDFAYNNDVRPVSDPNIFSETQRLAQNQALLQMATSAPPGMFDLRAVYRRILSQLKLPAIDEVLPNPLGAKESNPALENVSMTMGRAAAAYPDQDHLAHIKIHLEYANNPAYGGNPVIGPTFSPHALEHIKQHLTLHYLQSMRACVAQAQGGKDTLELHQEKPLDLEAQQALALASQMVGEDSQQVLGQYIPKIQELAQKVQQASQQQRQLAAESDPTASVILKTQTAETQRKAQESQARMQLDMQKDKQTYELKIAELQQKVNELQTKYHTQTVVDSNKNATNIAMADINNASRERIAYINAQQQFDADQQAMAHEQNQTALAASHAAQQEIRQHGLEIEKKQFEQQAQAVQSQIEAQQQAALQQQAAAPQPTPPQGQ
jgi:hypothetical protein